MATYIALLRGINVGGKRMKMADVSEMFEQLGYENVQTILASGNVIFESDETDTASIISAIEAAIVERFGFESRIILRTPQTLQSAIENAPFTQAQLAEAKFAHIMFLSDNPTQENFEALLAWHKGKGNEVMTLNERELYIYYTDGAGRSKLTTNNIEKHLKVIGTARNWNTAQGRILPALD